MKEYQSNERANKMEEGREEGRGRDIGVAGGSGERKEGENIVTRRREVGINQRKYYMLDKKWGWIAADG